MSNGKKIRSIEGYVHHCTQETADTWTLHVETSKEDRNYQAGQFVSIDPHQFEELSELIVYFEHQKGRKELVRAYSMASAPHEDFVSITIKPERFDPAHDAYPPLLSPFLASPFMKGRKLQFLGYTGPYVLPAEYSEVLHLVSGSGIVPNFALIKDQLTQNKNPNAKHILIDVNKSYDDIIFRKELDELAQQYPTRFKLIHCLTREKRPGFIESRPSIDLIRQNMINLDQALIYVCGAAQTKWQKKHAEKTGGVLAPRFIESMTEIVQQLGVDKKRFKHESYG